MSLGIEIDKTERMNRLSDLEELIGVDLPHDYRQWLVNLNINEINRRLFNIENNEFAVIHHIYKLANDEDCYDIVRNFKREMDVTPKGYLPIADEVTGSKILIGYEKPDYGKIFFLNTDGAPKIYEISESFESFVENLSDTSLIVGKDCIISDIVQDGNTKYFKKLLSEGLDYENLDKYDRNLLEQLVVLGDIDFIKILLDYHPRIRSSINLAKKNLIYFPEKYQDIVSVLLKYEEETVISDSNDKKL